MAGVVAAGMLWWIGRHTVEPIELKANGLILRHGDCRVALPVVEKRKLHLRADVAEIERRYLTFPDGEEVIDERIELPENVHFSKALNGTLETLFGADKIETVADNGRVAVYRCIKDHEKAFLVAALYRGRADLHLLYPLSEMLAELIRTCLMEGKRPKEPIIMNQTLQREPVALPETRWNEREIILQNLFEKEM